VLLQSAEMIPFSKKSYATQISELVFDHKRKKMFNPEGPEERSHEIHEK
jgi:hypothetical protein